MSMTEARYLEDAYLKELNATVDEIGETPDKQTFLILDQTIMYPMGGGQPSDKGEISGKEGVLKIKAVDYNGGAIKHIGRLSGILKAGDNVKITIDWADRYEHMQLHTAGHLLDAVVRKLYPALVPTKGVHGIGKKLFIEYQGVIKVDIELINTQLSELIASGTPINTHFTTLEELKKMVNWLPPKLPTSKKLRVLSIGEYHIPDGGTQLRNTQEAWPITATHVTSADELSQIHYIVEQQKESKGMQTNAESASAEPDIDIPVVKSAFIQESAKTKTVQDIEKLRIKYLSKSHGVITKLMRALPMMSADGKRKLGPQLNGLKNFIENALLQSAEKIDSGSNNIDLTIPHAPRLSGRLHPTTIVIRELNEFFRSQGFSIQEGPEIETPEYNFRRLNLPEGHPATDLQDTLYIREPDLLMRTHTSSIQTRILSGYKPPMRVVVPGKVYRNETKSSTNSSFFYQYQGFVVDRGVTIQNLKEMLTRVHQFLFGEDVILRFRYKYYPEVSPGMGVDMQCRFCKGEGCQVCKYRGWIETLGSGMTHYNCYKSCGIDPEVWTGYSFGLGLDRLVMNKFGINDIRKLYGGELTYL